ncbi:hypothetical protein F5051DRAFT_303309, partial [Lentinula edodes]
HGQYAKRSWWPRLISWKSSGFNCGYWSNDAEDWFQQRLNTIRHSSDSIQLLTNNQWRSALKFNKDAPRLSKSNNQISAEYLQSFIQF